MSCNQNCFSQDCYAFKCEEIFYVSGLELYVMHEMSKKPKVKSESYNMHACTDPANTSHPS